MNLHRVRDKKLFHWPSAFTPLPEGRKLTHLGAQNFRLRNRVLRGEAGFIVDTDAPGESAFCREDAGFLEPVPRADREAALEKIKEQGPIDFQPALDWLDEQGLREQVARPPVVEEASPSPSRMKKAALEAECDRLELPHGTVKEMRAAIESQVGADEEQG